MPRRHLLALLVRARRLLAVGLLALHGGIVTSPLWETHTIKRVGVHAEQHGARHVGMHDEATCAVCAVRSLHAAPADRPEPVARFAPLPATAVVTVGSAQSHDAADTGLPRAPPASA